jgi:hypothetical protein
MTPHTPTPWKLDEQYAQPHHICGSISIRDEGIKLIVTCQYGTGGRDEARANAAHIVCCVNEREGLLQALKVLIGEASNMANDHHRPRYARLDACLESAQALLAQAEQEGP